MPIFNKLVKYWLVRKGQSFIRIDVQKKFIARDEGNFMQFCHEVAILSLILAL